MSSLIKLAAFGDRKNLIAKVQERKAQLEQRVDLEEKERSGYTALAIAVAREHIEVVRYLLSEGAKVNAQDKKGQTPLHYCAMNYSIDIAKLLLSFGAEVNIADVYGNYSIWTAAFNVKGDETKHEMVKLLLASGANIDHVNVAGHSTRSLATIVKDNGLQELFKQIS